MERWVALFASIVVCLTAAACTTESMSTSTVDQITLKDLMTRIRCEFLDVADENIFRASDPWLIQGELTASVNNTRERNGELKLTPFQGPSTFTLGLSSGVETKKTSQLTLKFSLDTSKTSGRGCEATNRIGMVEWFKDLRSAENSEAGIKMRSSIYSFNMTFALIKTQGLDAKAEWQVVPISAMYKDAQQRDDVQNLTIAMAPRSVLSAIAAKPKSDAGGATASGSKRTLSTIPVPFRDQLLLQQFIDRKKLETFGGPNTSAY